MGHKSLASLQILKILKDYSDKEHLLTQKQIAEYLERDYDIAIERKTVARNLENLTAAGYQIEQTPKGVYLDDEREFDDSELRLLIDSVLFSKHISANYARELISKLQKLGSADLRRSLGVIHRADQVQRKNFAGLFYTIETISAAIGEKRKVRFVYNEYRLDKKLHPVFDAPVIMNPYQLFAANGHYYVIGEIGDAGRVESFRIERITDIEISEKAAGNKNGSVPFDIGGYIAAHPYLYPGEKADIKLKMGSWLAGELIDAFGDQFSVLDEENGVATVSLQAGLPDMLDWAKRFAEHVEIISPQILRNALRKISFPTAGKYFHSEEDRYARALEYLKKQEKAPDKERPFHFDGIDLSGREEYKKYTFCNTIALRNNHLSDMSFLSGFSEIVEADIEQNPVADLSFLKGRKELRELILKDTEVTDISFLEGAAGLISFSFKGKKLKDVSPVYGLFNLRKLEIDSVNAMQFDWLRLKRSCPNLQVKLAEFEGTPTLGEAVQFFSDGDIDSLFVLARMFAVEERNPRELLGRQDVEEALSFLQKNDRFRSADLQRTLRVGYPTVSALIRWMTDAEYIEKDKNGFYRRIEEV